MEPVGPWGQWDHGDLWDHGGQQNHGASRTVGPMGSWPVRIMGAVRTMGTNEVISPENYGSFVHFCVSAVGYVGVFGLD